MKFGEHTQIVFARSVIKVPKFYEFKMADGRHIENRFSAIPQRFIV